jgi:L-ascorbate metabolism protein UlaG (beta-lactamase superfamily)
MHHLTRRSLVASAGALSALLLAAPLLIPAPSWSQAPEPITLQTTGGPLVLRPLKHGSVLVVFKGKNYYVDPAQLPASQEYAKADAILITHEHGDHCDPQAVNMLKKAGTVIIANARSAEKLHEGQVMKNGESRRVLDLTVEAVPAYNIERTQFHPKGRDNGYVLTAGGKRVYFAGDTEGTPEMKALKNIDVAFLPINLPYTMPPKDAAEAARAFKPKLLVPYHQGQSNPQEVADTLKGTGIEVRVLKLP